MLVLTLSRTLNPTLNDLTTMFTVEMKVVLALTVIQTMTVTVAVSLAPTLTLTLKTSRLYLAHNAVEKGRVEGFHLSLYARSARACVVECVVCVRERERAECTVSVCW